MMTDKELGSSTILGMGAADLEEEGASGVKTNSDFTGTATLAVPNPIRSASSPVLISLDSDQESTEADEEEAPAGKDESVPTGATSGAQPVDSPVPATPIRPLGDVRGGASPFSVFFRNLLTLLFRPNHFWETQRENPTSILHVHWPHLILLIALRSVAQLVGGLFNPSIAWSTAVVHATTGFLFLFFFVWLFALVVAGISAVSEAECQVADTVRFTAYAITPLFFIGFLAIIPVPHLQPIADAIAMPYTFYVLGAGVISYLRIPERKAAALTGLMCGILLCLWGLLPIYLPMLIGSIFGSAPM